MKLKSGFVFAVCVILAVSVIVFKKKYSQDKEIIRKTASIQAAPKTRHQFMAFLTQQELKMLSPRDQKKYLGGVAKIIFKAGFLKGAFSHGSKNGKSARLFFKNILIEEAFASSNTCPVRGLYPMKNEGNCRAPGRLKINGDAVNLFSSSTLKEHEGKTFTSCPDGQEMCNPLLLGFAFDEEGKARLRCFEHATNEYCYKNVSTNAEDMRKTYEILNDANHLLWDEFAQGIEDLCLENGSFKEGDEGCDYVRKQMDFGVRKYRAQLNSKYQELAGKLNQTEAGSSNTERAQEQRGDELPPEGAQVCEQKIRNSKISNPENFIGQGQKFIRFEGHCYRFPKGAFVRKKTSGDKTEYYICDSSRVGSGARENLSVAETLRREREQHLDVCMGGRQLKKLGPFSNSLLNSVNFFNFDCGPCNGAKDTSECVERLSSVRWDRNSFARVGIQEPEADGSLCSDLRNELSGLKWPSRRGVRGQQNNSGTVN